MGLKFPEIIRELAGRLHHEGFPIASNRSFHISLVVWIRKSFNTDRRFICAASRGFSTGV